MIAIAQPPKTNPQTLEQLQTLLEQEIEEAKSELLQLKKSKQYTQQIVNEIDAHDEIIQQHNYILDDGFTSANFDIDDLSWLFVLGGVSFNPLTNF